MKSDGELQTHAWPVTAGANGFLFSIQSRRRFLALHYTERSTPNTRKSVIDDVFYSKFREDQRRRLMIFTNRQKVKTVEEG